MTDGTHIIYPVMFGWVIHGKSPLRTVNMKRSNIVVDLEVDTFTKVIRLMLLMSYPDHTYLDNNLDLIENCVRIHNALDYLGIMFYPEFFQGLSVAVN